MRLLINFFNKEMEISTSSSSPDEIIKVYGHPRFVEYLNQVLLRNFSGIYGKQVFPENLTNLDLIKVLEDNGLILDYEPKLTTNSQKTFETEQIIL